MNHTQNFHENQILPVCDGIGDGLYLVLLGASDVPAYFPISNEELVPGDYLKILRQHIDDVGGMLSAVHWVLYGVITNGRMQLVNVINMLAEATVYPNFYAMPGRTVNDGYYLALVNLDRPTIQYFPIDGQQLLEGEHDMFKLLSEHVEDVRKELQTSDMFMIGQAKHNYFHVIQQMEINDF
ncbi:hypothetical protein FC26_GL000449 [Paucilactobacillus vaccinostercus DSM 20634]|uniref:Uncharacterized protein n=1 Tax=Paucilactobacillus vaccinostercus DSM 20634 TaxID=1423813 RepID=A0A0R2A0N0_9LACO|nr:hypothetical protein [Paucilactobacillus vaccinostercus]KRM60641.1 hypothetical protein FC26_GL000449 [Paucilactobacillus vaccinostercus DSM 20634]